MSTSSLPKSRFEKLKEKLKSPEVVGLASAIGIGVLTLSGWIVADLNRRKLDRIVEFDPQVHLAVGSEVLQEVREDGVVLRYWTDGNIEYMVTGEETREDIEARVKNYRNK